MLRHVLEIVDNLQRVDVWNMSEAELVAYRDKLVAICVKEESNVEVVSVDLDDIEF